MYEKTDIDFCTILLRGEKKMKEKCPICLSRNSKGIKYSDYCKKCGLFLGEIKKDKVIETIDAMVEKWNTPKKFDYYTKWEDGHVRFNYRGVKKLIDNITFGDDLTFEQFGALVQIISYLTIEFDFNITGLAVTMFAFASQFIEDAKRPFNYWLKVGIKEKNRATYDYLLGCMYSSEADKTRKGRRKIQKIKKILRSLPNYQI